MDDEQEIREEPSGLRVAEGPFRDLVAYCEAESAAFADVRSGEGAAALEIASIGVVQLIELGDTLGGASLGLGVTRPDGFYVAEELEFEDFNGGDFDDFLERTTLKSRVSRTLTVVFRFRSSKTLWANEGSRPEQPVRWYDREVQIECALDSDDRFVCAKPRETTG